MTEPGPASKQLVAAFAADYSFAFDDFQQDACLRLASGHGVLVAAPTGSGKTVVGEFACWLALEHGTKCFYTTPIKALSNQKFHDLVAKHGAQNVGLLTGDTSVNSEAPLVVMTTEVLRNMIYARSATLSGLSYVVMDEVHYLADRFRGAVWEEVILGLADSVCLVALSATVSNAEEFGEWLDEVRGEVDVVVSEERVVPLYQHVLVGRKLLDLFAGQAPTAVALPQARADVNPELLRLAKAESRVIRDDSRRTRGRRIRGKIEARQGGSVVRPPRRDGAVEVLAQHDLLPAIFFIFSRQGCDQAVHQLLGSNIRLTTGAERGRLLQIAENHARTLSADDKRALDWETFIEALGRGIAARTVVVEKLVKYNGETHAELSPGEYTQLTGRAGRRGIDVEGHAVVFWQPGMDPRALAGLASRRTYPLRSSFAPTYNMAVNLVGSIGRVRARALLEQSFAQFQTDRRVVALARQASRDDEQAAIFWQQAECDRGDFREYAELRDRIGTLESEVAKERKRDHRADIVDSFAALDVGDVFWIPSGKHQGWAAVITPTKGHRQWPTVMTQTRQIVELTEKDANQPVTVISRVRVPKKFDRRSVADRRQLANSLVARAESLGKNPTKPHKVRAEGQLAAEIAELRAQLRAHPCHGCPDREQHARAAEQALRLSRGHERTKAKARARSQSIATRFDRVCGVLDSLGYLDGDALTSRGRMLTRIYNELDLLVAESIIDGVFDGLDVPELAAVLSSLVYESRGDQQGQLHRMPDLASEQAQSRVRKIWRDLGVVERDNRVERTSAPDIGFADAAFQWASGMSLADVLGSSGLPAGDFVRWVRQVIDLAGCRELVRVMRRDIADFSPDED